jgi:hypothetical protein
VGEAQCLGGQQAVREFSKEVRQQERPVSWSAEDEQNAACMGGSKAAAQFIRARADRPLVLLAPHRLSSSPYKGSTANETAADIFLAQLAV